MLVGINRFLTDTPAELKLIEDKCAAGRRQGLSLRALGQGWCGRRGPGAAASWPRSTKARRPSSRSMPTTCRSRRRSRPWRRRSIAPRASPIAGAGAAPAQGAGGDGLRQAAGLHRQDAVQLRRRPRTARRADRARAADPRGAPVGRCRLRGRHGRRHHEHARPAAGAGGGADPPDREWRGRRDFLRCAPIRSSRSTSSPPPASAATRSRSFPMRAA